MKIKALAVTVVALGLKRKRGLVILNAENSDR